MNVTLKSSKPFIVKKRKKLNERILDAYDKGFADGYETGIAELEDFKLDMEFMAAERKEVGLPW